MNEFYNKMKYFEDVEKIPARIYYHYTSVDALYKIVKSRTFRLTSLKSSNDKKELFYKAEQFLRELNAVYEEESHESTKKYFECIKESVNQNSDKFMSQFKTKRFPYALCLSEKKDNLTHWDRYATGCTGVCIGFNVSALTVYLERNGSTSFGIGLYDIGKVVYSTDDRKKYIRQNLIKFFKMMYENEASNVDKEKFKELILRNSYIYAASVALQLAKFSKTDSFVDEDEIRLYHDTASIKSTLDLIDSMSPQIDEVLYCNVRKKFKQVTRNLKLDKEDFCMTQRGIRGYKNLYLGEVWGSGVIPEIILGPTCVQNTNELKRFLKANGLEGTKVKASEVPIR